MIVAVSLRLVVYHRLAAAIGFTGSPCCATTKMAGTDLGEMVLLLMVEEVEQRRQRYHRGDGEPKTPENANAYRSVEHIHLEMGNLQTVSGPHCIPANLSGTIQKERPGPKTDFGLKWTAK
jgi:hypothetical protein